jgi:hypothetical protein
MERSRICGVPAARARHYSPHAKCQWRQLRNTAPPFSEKRRERVLNAVIKNVKLKRVRESFCDKKFTCRNTDLNNTSYSHTAPAAVLLKTDKNTGRDVRGSRARYYLATTVREVSR